MSDHHPRRTTESELRVSADRGALLSTIVRLWPYIWPSERADLKMRVVGSLLLLLAA
jgi:ATP-binding cassette subfamily B protein